jgi:Uma2 family endonuclease
MATVQARRPALRIAMPRPCRFGPRSAGITMTVEDFDAIPSESFEPGYRYELINGVLIVSPPVRDAEADPNDYLGHLLYLYQETHPNGAAIDATMPERTVPATDQRRRCDRAIWAGLGRIPDTRTETPAIIVEFVSAERRDILRDYEQKRDEYLAAGVKEYWIIDRFRRIMTVYRPGRLGPKHQIIAETETYTTKLLPGFELPLARLLERADRWNRKKIDAPPTKKAKSTPRPKSKPDGESHG